MPQLRVLDSQDLPELTRQLAEVLNDTLSDPGHPAHTALFVQDSRGHRLQVNDHDGDYLSGLADKLSGDTVLVVNTSGSTATSKMVELSAPALIASATATHIRLGGAGQWLLALPTTYVAGLAVVLRSLLAETELVQLPAGPFDAELFLQTALELTHDRRYTSLVPVQLLRLVELLESGDLIEKPELTAAAQRFDAILIGGQALDRGVRQRAERHGLNVIETYGATETSGGCVYDGYPLDGVQVAFDGEEILLTGPTLATGYVAEPELTARRFFEAEGRDWYRTGDRGRIIDNKLIIDGRIDNIIITGGLKVSLDEVKLVVTDLEDCEETYVFAQPDEEWGTAPVVVVVSKKLARLDREGAMRQADRIHQAVVTKLGRAATPARILLLGDIDRLDSGKPDLVALKEQVLGKK